MPTPISQRFEPFGAVGGVPVEAEQAQGQERQRGLGVLLCEHPGGQDESEQNGHAQVRAPGELDLEVECRGHHQRHERLDDPDAVVDEEEGEHDAESGGGQASGEAAQASGEQAHAHQRQEAGDRGDEADRHQRVHAELDPRDAKPEHERLAPDRERVEEVLRRVGGAVGEDRVCPLVEEVGKAVDEEEAGGDVRDADRRRHHERRAGALQAADAGPSRLGVHLASVIAMGCSVGRWDQMQRHCLGVQSVRCTR